MKSLFLLLAIVSFGTLTQMSAQSGTAGFEPLKIGVGARALAMGEAYSAIASDPSSTYYNPAAMSLSSAPQILLMHKAWIQGTRTEFIGATTTNGNLSLGLGANSTSIDDIDLRTGPGPPLGTFGAQWTSIGLSGSYAFDPSLSIGLTAKYLYEKIYVYDASGLAFDFGGLYRTPWDISLAVALSNLGSMNELDKESSKLPACLRIGTAYERELPGLEASLLLSGDIVSFIAEGKSHLHLGGEFNFKNTFAARVGYQTGYDAKGFSAGVGIHYDIVAVDYAFVPFQEDLGTTHTFSVGITFQ